MTLDELITKYTGKVCNDYGPNPGQCVNIVKAYNALVVGAPELWGNAIDYLKNPLPQYYDFHDDPAWYIPPRGSIAIFDSTYGNGLGHCGIVTEANIFNQRIFQQNDPENSACMTKQYDYKHIPGYLIPRTQLVINLFNNLVDDLNNLTKKYSKVS
jgi:hypothetical protein